MKRANLTFLILGIFVGISILNPLAQAAENWLKATPSAQKFFVNGKQVELEAYAIEGHNYVKLRDIGKAANFGVSYDPMANCVIVRTDQPYQEDATREPGETAKPVVASTPAAVPDYSAQANPAIFTGELTREVYNALRDAVVYQDEILAGTYPMPKVQHTRSGDWIDQAASTIGRHPIFDTTQGDGLCHVRYPEVDAPAVEHLQGFLKSLEGLSDREKAEKICWYICDRMTYAVKYPYPSEVLSQDGVVEGCCMAYAYSFQFLCDLADIPCILVQNDIHQWNRAYVDGRWWSVDISGTDAGNDVSLRRLQKVLHPDEDLQGSIFVDGSPKVTRFVEELLVPGSTKR